MKEYLIWTNFGGDMECPNRMQDYYKIASGTTEEEAVEDWAKQNSFNMKDIKNYEYWAHHGRRMSIVELVKDNGFKDWKTIKWV